MNYQKIYNSIIERAKSRLAEGYTESHHIIPRSIGGSNDHGNLVNLTAREHFIAHLLLAKIYGGGLWHAAHMMSNMKKYSNRDYKKVREEHAKLVSAKMTGRTFSEETLEKMRKPKSESSKVKMRKSKSDDHVQNWKESRANGAGWVCPDSKKEKQKLEMVGEGNPMFGKTHSDSTRKKITEANKVKVTCPHCGKVGGIAIMKRWHYDNCKNA
jgi:hypothetical protein